MRLSFVRQYGRTLAPINQEPAKLICSIVGKAYLAAPRLKHCETRSPSLRNAVQDEREAKSTPKQKLDSRKLAKRRQALTLLQHRSHSPPQACAQVSHFITLTAVRTRCTRHAEVPYYYLHPLPSRPQSRCFATTALWRQWKIVYPDYVRPVSQRSVASPSTVDGLLPPQGQSRQRRMSTSRPFPGPTASSSTPPTVA